MFASQSHLIIIPLLELNIVCRFQPILDSLDVQKKRLQEVLRGPEEPIGSGVLRQTTLTTTVATTPISTTADLEPVFHQSISKAGRPFTEHFSQWDDHGLYEEQEIDAVSSPTCMYLPVQAYNYINI